MNKIKTMSSGLRSRALPSIVTALGLIAVVASTPATAAKFGVKIVNEAGQSLAGTAVCIGMHGNYTQFGSMLTDKSGLAMMEVPKVPFVLTVSKSGTGAIRINEPARGFNLIKEITLTKDASGPKCNVVDLEKSESSVKISDVHITESTYTTILNPRVVGEPTEYRVSRTPTFTGAKWKLFQTSIPLSASLSEEDEVYIQMRRYSGTRKGWIEARSDVVNVKLPTFE